MEQMTYCTLNLDGEYVANSKQIIRCGIVIFVVTLQLAEII
jgi:hypothetical protein